MTVTIKNPPELVRPNGSHHLALATGRAIDNEPFEKEELHPILELDAPRVGLVRASFSCDRYVSSSWDEAAGTSSPVWTGWRIILRDVRTPNPDEPETVYSGRPAAGIGIATRRAIADACEPIIRAWLESDAYRRSRRKVAAGTVRRTFEAPASYRLEHARQTLDTLERLEELGPMEADHLRGVLEHLDAAAAGLAREALAD